MPLPPFKRALPEGTLFRFCGALLGAGTRVGGRGVRVGGRVVRVGNGVRVGIGVRLGTGVLLKVSVGRGVAVGMVGDGVKVGLADGVMEAAGKGGSIDPLAILTANTTGIGVVLGSMVGACVLGDVPQADRHNIRMRDVNECLTTVSSIEGSRYLFIEESIHPMYLREERIFIPST